MEDPKRQGADGRQRECGRESEIKANEGDDVKWCGKVPVHGSERNDSEEDSVKCQGQGVGARIVIKR